MKFDKLINSIIKEDFGMNDSIDDNSQIMAELKFLQNKYDRANNKVYRSHHKMHDGKEYLEQWRRNVAFYKQCRQNYIDFLNIHKIVILNVPELKEMVAKFKEKHYSI